MVGCVGGSGPGARQTHLQFRCTEGGFAWVLFQKRLKDTQRLSFRKKELSTEVIVERPFHRAPCTRRKAGKVLV